MLVIVKVYAGLILLQKLKWEPTRFKDETVPREPSEERSALKAEVGGSDFFKDETLPREPSEERSALKAEVGGSDLYCQLSEAPLSPMIHARIILVSYSAPPSPRIQC